MPALDALKLLVTTLFRFESRHETLDSGEGNPSSGIDLL